MTVADKQVAVVDAVTGSTVSATLTMAARGTAVRGRLVTMEAGSDLLLGRVDSVNLTNAVHADPTFATHIMVEGGVRNFSKEIDVEKAEISLLRAADRATGQLVPMRVNPCSGTAVMPVTQQDLAPFTGEREHFLNIGTIPNCAELIASLINRSHADVALGGYGEARHTAVFGQSGSGKTVFFSMLLAGKLAAHPKMGLLMPDTAGDLSDPTRHDRGDFHWNYAEVLRHAGVSLEIISIADIRLSSCQLLVDLLQDLFQESLTTTDVKARTLAQRVVEAMYDKEVALELLMAETILGHVKALIGHVYSESGNSRASKQQEAVDLATNPARRARFDREIEYVRTFYDGRHRLADLITGVLSDGRKVIIKMDDSVMGGKYQEHVMREVMTKLIARSRKLFAGGERGSANAVVALDEAARWVPEGEVGGDSVAPVIKRAVRETRKYGLGWSLIAQSPASVDKTILRETHTKWFGRGLGIGADARHLDDTLRKSGVEEYERLMLQGGFFFVGIGLDNNIGTEGTHMSVRPFDGDATRGFVAANPHIFGHR